MLSGKLFFIVSTIWLPIISSVISVTAGEKEPDHQSLNSITESEFRTQYAVAARKFKSSFQNVQCRAECQYQLDDPNDHSRKITYDFSAHLMMKGNSAVSVQDYAKDTPRSGTVTNQVACATPHYAFDLHKTNPDAPYLLNYITHASARVERKRLIMGDDLDVFLSAASFMYHNPFDAILKKPTFTVVKLERFTSNSDENEELVALDFRLTNDPWFISSGHVVFSPHLNWAVLEYNYRCDYSATDYSMFSGKNRFSSVQKQAVPFPEKCEHTSLHYHAGMLPIVEINSATLSDASIGTVDDSVFLLSHYGLSDAPLVAPPFSVKRIVRWFLIGNGVLLFLIVIGVVIKRSRTTRSPEGQA